MCGHLVFLDEIITDETPKYRSRWNSARSIDLRQFLVRFLYGRGSGKDFHCFQTASAPVFVAFQIGRKGPQLKQFFLVGFHIGLMCGQHDSGSINPVSLAESSYQILLVLA
jgi:hypothetical protein